MSTEPFQDTLDQAYAEIDRLRGENKALGDRWNDIAYERNDLLKERDKLRSEREELRAERDALLAAAKRAECTMTEYELPSQMYALNELRAAIKAAEGR